MTDSDAFGLSNIIEIYVGLETATGLKTKFPDPAARRDEEEILNALKSYTNHTFMVHYQDLYDGLEYPIGRSRDFYSKCLINEKNDKKTADIWINDHILPDGVKLVNFCWKRFCIVKEACQVVIREDFQRRGRVYPNANKLDDLVDLYRNLVRFKFSIFDFDNPEYPLDTKVENAAEILAILLLYPIEQMIADRARLAMEETDAAFSTSHADIAEGHKVPERYVELFLTSGELDEINAQIDMMRAGAW